MQDTAGTDRLKLCIKITYSPEAVVWHAECMSQTLEHQRNCEK